MTLPTVDVLPLARMALALGRVNRATLHEDGVTQESDTDHTVMLALIAAATAPAHLDARRVVTMALVHDLVEAVVGDTDTFNATADVLADKERREAEGFGVLARELARFPIILNWIDVYRHQQSPEAQWVRVMDKVMPKITHVLNGGAALRQRNVSLQDLIGIHAREAKKLHAEMWSMQSYDRALDVFHAACGAAEEAYARTLGCDVGLPQILARDAWSDSVYLGVRHNEELAAVAARQATEANEARNRLSAVWDAGVAACYNEAVALFRGTAVSVVTDGPRVVLRGPIVSDQPQYIPIQVTIGLEKDRPAVLANLVGRSEAPGYGATVSGAIVDLDHLLREVGDVVSGRAVLDTFAAREAI